MPSAVKRRAWSWVVVVGAPAGEGNAQSPELMVLVNTAYSCTCRLTLMPRFSCHICCTASTIRGVVAAVVVKDVQLGEARPAWVAGLSQIGSEPPPPWRE